MVSQKSENLTIRFQKINNTDSEAGSKRISVMGVSSALIRAGLTWTWRGWKRLYSSKEMVDNEVYRLMPIGE